MLVFAFSDYWGSSDYVYKIWLSLVQEPRFSFFTPPPSHFGRFVFAFLDFWGPTDYVYKIWLNLIQGHRFLFLKRLRVYQWRAVVFQQGMLSKKEPFIFLNFNLFLANHFYKFHRIIVFRYFSKLTFFITRYENKTIHSIHGPARHWSVICIDSM